MVNRNTGAGTRLLIDQLLAGARPPGYWNQPRSHNAVAAAVAQGRADWGVAIEPSPRLWARLPAADRGALRLRCWSRPARTARRRGIPRRARRARRPRALAASAWSRLKLIIAPRGDRPRRLERRGQDDAARPADPASRRARASGLDRQARPSRLRRRPARQGFPQPSHRGRDRGAGLARRSRWALMHELRGAPEPTLGDLLAQARAGRSRHRRGLQARGASEARSLPRGDRQAAALIRTTRTSSPSPATGRSPAPRAGRRRSTMSPRIAEILARAGGAARRSVLRGGDADGPAHRRLFRLRRPALPIEEVERLIGERVAPVAGDRDGGARRGATGACCRAT